MRHSSVFKSTTPTRESTFQHTSPPPPLLRSQSLSHADLRGAASRGASWFKTIKRFRSKPDLEFGCKGNLDEAVEEIDETDPTASSSLSNSSVSPLSLPQRVLKLTGRSLYQYSSSALSQLPRYSTEGRERLSTGSECSLEREARQRELREEERLAEAACHSYISTRNLKARNSSLAAIDHFVAYPLTPPFPPTPESPFSLRQRSSSVHSRLPPYSPPLSPPRLNRRPSVAAPNYPLPPTPPSPYTTLHPSLSPRSYSFI